MSAVLLQNLSNISVTVPTSNLSGGTQGTTTILPGGVFFGDSSNAVIAGLIQAGYLTAATGTILTTVPVANLPTNVALGVPTLTSASLLQNTQLPTPVSGAFTGANNAGPGSASITVAGATIGQRVFFILDTTATDTTPAAHFETTISVAGHIQQTDVANLSANKYAVLLL
jgi:hypothetical protein